MQQGYGLTETSPMVSFLAPEFSFSKLGSSGRTPLFTEIKLVDGDGDIVHEPGAPGEVMVRGPNVMAGTAGSAPATLRISMARAF
jgi:long-subunit acyl-CoA synthetase (AMP-forming)